MKMSHLIRNDIPPEVIRLWQQKVGERLLPVQELAVKRHDLFGRNNLLIQAPTSSGKTFVGEMAAVQTALRGKKVVYLVPLRALAEEKFRDFRAKYESYGVKVIVSSRDRREYDRDLEEGDFSIAIVVYEKLSHLLVRRPEQLEEIELVVADELEILSDPERGADVEVLLTRVLRSSSRLIGMSAVIGEAERLSEWMRADLVRYEQRPVELRFGVLYDGVFRYKTYNALGEGEEHLEPSDPDSNWETLSANVGALAEGGDSNLIFVKAKHEALRGAEMLAKRLDLPAADGCIDALRDSEPTRARATLLDTLTSGVAFHSADLSSEERQVVEEGFRNGEVRVIVSTSTLAVGLNLPARNVFITADKWRYDSRFGMPWKAPIARAEYENMGGRAGRYGAGQEYGRSILIASTAFEFETLWRRYIEGDREGISPQLDREPLENHVLRLVASRTCRTVDELVSFLEGTLTGHWVWQREYPLDEIEDRIRCAVNRAMDAGVVGHSSDERLEATPFGQAVAAKGIQIETAQQLETWVSEAETRDWSELDLLIAAAVSPDGRMYNVTLTAQEYEHAGYHARLKYEAEIDDSDTPLQRMLASQATPFFEDVRAIKVALLLKQWVDQEPLADLEERFHTMTGQICSAADQLAWLVDAAAAIASARTARHDFVSRLRSFSLRMAHGVGEGGLELAKLQNPVLPRKVMLDMLGHGLHSAGTIVRVPTRALEQWMSREEARALMAWARCNAEPSERSDSVSQEVESGMPVLRVDEDDPGVLYLEGAAVRLQEKQFRLIQVLAESPGRCVPYEQIYEAVWGDAVVENNQMHFQKRKLLERIVEANPAYKKVVRTVPKRGFVLNLTPEQVELQHAAAV